jgi:anti-sigma factor ChrR (cupin superfamily)
MNIENNCFCELAPLYVLGSLSEVERLWVEQQLAEYPELFAELAQYETAVAALSYSVPVVPMAENLKERLFASLALESAVIQPQPEPFPEVPENTLLSVLAIRKEDVQWQAHRTPGVEIAILHKNEIKREIVGLLRAAAGVFYPLHQHATGEDIYMLEGDLVIGDEVYGAFDYIRSQAGSTHATYTNQGCMFFFRTSMDDEYPDLVRAEV